MSSHEIQVTSFAKTIAALQAAVEVRPGGKKFKSHQLLLPVPLRLLIFSRCGTAASAAAAAHPYYQATKTARIHRVCSRSTPRPSLAAEHNALTSGNVAKRSLPAGAFKLFVLGWQGCTSHALRLNVIVLNLPRSSPAFCSDR